MLNSLGELSSRSAASQQARDYHGQALAIARRDRRTAGGSTRPGRNRPQPPPGRPRRRRHRRLEQALAIYQRIGAPDARRVQHTLGDHPAKQNKSDLLRNGDNRQERQRITKPRQNWSLRFGWRAQPWGRILAKFWGGCEVAG